MGLDLAPHGGGLEGAGPDNYAGEERPQASAALWSPAMQVGQFGQFVDGDELGRKLLAGESAREVSGWPSFEDRRGDVGVDDDVAHARPARL